MSFTDNLSSSNFSRLQVQTAETEVGKLATDYHPKELELFKEIVSLILSGAANSGRLDFLSYNINGNAY